MTQDIGENRSGFTAGLTAVNIMNSMPHPTLTRKTMKIYRYQLRFTTPAFLGNASQQGQWRTPPVKALLRQWWRVAVAQELGYSAERLRQREADLFGVAADGGDSHQSLIRIRLGQWSEGKLKDWVVGT